MINGKILGNDAALLSLGIVGPATVHYHLRFRGGGKLARKPQRVIVLSDSDEGVEIVKRRKVSKSHKGKGKARASDQDEDAEATSDDLDVFKRVGPFSWSCRLTLTTDVYHHVFGSRTRPPSVELNPNGERPSFFYSFFVTNLFTFMQ